MRVAVLGASPKRERYANRAVRELRSKGHDVVPVNPGHAEIEGLKVAATLDDIIGAIDTVTVYVGPQSIGPLIPSIVALKPRRVIINPGAESAELTTALTTAGIEPIEACTLVMLSTGQF